MLEYKKMENNKKEGLTELFCFYCGYYWYVRVKEPVRCPRCTNYKYSSEKARLKWESKTPEERLAISDRYKRIAKELDNKKPSNNHNANNIRRIKLTTPDV